MTYEPVKRKTPKIEDTENVDNQDTDVETVSEEPAVEKPKKKVKKVGISKHI